MRRPTIGKGDEIRQRKQDSYGEKIVRYNVAAYVEGKHPQIAILRFVVHSLSNTYDFFCSNAKDGKKLQIYQTYILPISAVGIDLHLDSCLRLD